MRQRKETAQKELVVSIICILQYITLPKNKICRSYSKIETNIELLHYFFMYFKEGNQKERRNERRAKNAADGNNGKMS